MGNVIFGVDIARIVAAAIGPGVLEATITNYQPGARNPANISAGIPKVAVVHECRGFWEDYEPTDIDGRLILVNDRKAVLIGDTIPEGAIPGPGSAIMIEGQTLFVHRLESRDPAAAAFVFQCRDRAGPDGQ
jgi:hypothetical protein